MMHLVNVQDPGKAPLACPGANCTVAAYQVASDNVFIGLSQVRNDMRLEVKTLSAEIAARQTRINMLTRIISELEATMVLESRSNEIAKALAESPELDKAAIISALLKKQELELSK
jgi:hypothetical protein